MLLRTFVLAAVVAGAVAFAGSAAASGPTTLQASGWQIYASSATYNNPNGSQIHGDPGEYAGAPAIPGETDSGWVNCGPSAPTRFGRNMCPNASTIGMGVTSLLSGCWSRLNFTWFQALVSIPAGTTISQFSVNMSGADDGARISLVNSAHPGGVTPAGGYIYQLTTQSTGNLASDVVAGEVNRVIVTQVDDCASGNNLGSAQISLNGTVIVPDTTAPSDAPVVSPAANAHGWNTSDVGVAWNWTDSGSGIDTANCPQSSSSSGEGTQTLSTTCSDVAGNSKTDTRTVKVDKTKPTDAPVVTISGNTASVAWHWADTLSGIDAANCMQSSSKSGGGLVTIASTCSDLAGNSATDSVQAQLDDTPPADNPSAVPAWSNDDVTVNWNWSDSGSGIDPANCTQSSTSSGEGAITLTSSCSDLAGNSASDSILVQVDKTGPTDAPVVPSGWNTSDATVAWNWADGGSGVDPANCTQSSTSSGEGTITLTSSCSDVAGNTSTDSVTVLVDKTAPVAAPVAPTGWQNADATVSWNWTDAGGSGLDPANCAQSSTSSGEGTITVTSSCSDVAGNSSSASATVQVDKTAPAVTYTGGGTYTVDQNVSIACSSSDALSGVASDTCAGVSAPAWSLGLGTHSLSASATDNAGNTGSGSTSYTVKADADSICALVTLWAKNKGQANSLCTKIRAAEAAAQRGQQKTKDNNINAFDNEVSAQSGKGFTAAQAALLVQFAAAL